MKTSRKIFGFLLSTMFVASCSETIDESARYVFKDDTIISYMERHPDDYSSFLDILKSVKVSEISESSLYQLLSARGNYTVFAPNNQAIENYLQLLTDKGFLSEPSWDGFPSEAKKDSIRKVVAYNSIIDGKDEVFYYTGDFPPESNGEMPLSNMNDRKITVRYVINEPDSLYINYDCPMSIKNRDIPAINGIVHQMEKVIAPEDITMSNLLTDIIDNGKEGFYVMSRLVLACGLKDTLSATEDKVYREKYIKGLVPDFNGKAFGWVFHGASQWPVAYAPEHRKYGFTIFAESDAFWKEELGKDFKDITPADVQQWIVDKHQYTEGDVFTTDEDYANEKNLLNQWVTYHILPMKIPANKLVIHANEKGYSYSQKQVTIPVFEFYSTMGKRRLIKLYESRESNGIYLNRFPNLDNGRRGTYHELSCDVDKEGNYVDNQSENVLLYEALNGIIYGIDKPLAYTDQVRENLARNRIRFDSMSLFPEAMSNDIRKKESTDPRDQFVHIPPTSTYQYFEGMDMNNETHFVYLNSYKYDWCNNQNDELKAEGHYEITIKLPPVPRKGTYELRYRVLPNGDRGIVQFYFGTDKDRLVPTGIPVDLTKSGTDPNYGFEYDTEDDDYNNEIDKHMRSNMRMKGTEYVTNSAGSARQGSPSNLRHILVRQLLDPDETYYLRLKSVLDSDKKEMYMDYLEWCAKEVYDNPMRPEDVW